MSHSYWLLFYLFGLSSCLSHLQFFTEVIAVWMTSECLEREGQKFSKTAEGWMKGEFICINSKTFSIFPLLCTWFSWCDCASLLLTFKPRATSLCYLSVTQSMHTPVSGHRIPLGFHFTVFKSVFLPLWTEGKVFPLQICLLCTSLVSESVLQEKICFISPWLFLIQPFYFIDFCTGHSCSFSANYMIWKPGLVQQPFLICKQALV